MTEPAFRSARKLARMVRRRQIGCLELLDHFIDRVERLDTRLNAVVVRDFERARERASEADRGRGHGKDGGGKLHGVPMTVKESFGVAGLPTTWGVEASRFVPARDSLLVERMQAAGANVFGKTNVPAMLADWQSFNPVYGSTGNPWDLARSPGGSSGGSAAALAAGLTGLEAGSDIGGSIRQPAHACGVYGHKPTYGLIPTFGHAPAEGIAGMLDITVVGPLARSADDLEIALDLLARPDEAETGLRYRLPKPRATRIGDLRVAVWAEDPAGPTDPEITAALHELARFLGREGAEVSLTARPAIQPREAFDIYLQLLSVAMNSRQPPERLEELRAAAAALAPDDRSSGAVQLRAIDLPHRDWIALNERRMRLRRAWGAFFHDWDVLLCPAFSVAAQRRMEDKPVQELQADMGGAQVPWGELLFWPGLTGGVHLPATAAPLARTRAGLPVGVQIVGPIYGDRTTIAVARMLEEAWRGFEAPEGWG